MTEQLKSCLCCILTGFLLCSAVAETIDGIANADLHGEYTHMIGTGNTNNGICKLSEMVPLHVFLQQGLIVLDAYALDSIFDACLYEAQDKLFCRCETSVEIYGSDNRFKCIGEDARLIASARILLTMALKQIIAELQLLCDLIKSGLIYRP